MTRAFDITGKRFGRLVALERAEPHPRYKQARWRCRCDCGSEWVNFGYLLWHGKVVSCGCYVREKLKAGDIRRRHGGTGTPEYISWAQMRDRCLRPGNPAYPDYGGRGITIREEWGDFVSFLRDMGPRPSPKHTLDRIDNDGPYSPGNCRWATRKEQVRNRRVSNRLEYEGEILNLYDWAERIGVDPETLRKRLKRGLTGDDLFAPPCPRHLRRQKKRSLCLATP